MSSTRRAQPGSEFAAEKFASSAEFERGLLGSLVARRCTALEDPKDKELIWAIHYFSHQSGGLKSLAAALLENYPEHFGTPAMVKIGKRSGQYSAEQVREIRRQIPDELRRKFILKGETLRDVNQLAAASGRRERLQQAMDALKGIDNPRLAQEIAAEKAAAQKHPNSYPIADFISLCRQEAESDLENSLRELCLNPACDPSNFLPWYFAGLVNALRAFCAQWIADRAGGLVITEIGREVIETLEYTAYSRKLTLVEGDSRIGKTFSARAWCELHPGQARFIEVPTGNDETSFFRALARGLGIGNFAQYKANEIRERVESVLFTGDLLLVLDEAWRLWPQQTEQRFGFPKRITWVMSMTNQDVPICLISTPQFLATLKAKEEKGGWNSAQFQGRLAQYKPLPAEVSQADLIAVVAAQLPEADNKTLRAIADYARSSAKYLAAIESIALRSRYLASRAGRDTVEAEDVRRAMKENVIPSDSNLVRVMESKHPSGGRRAMRAPAAVAELPEISNEQTPVPATRRAGRDTDLQPDAGGRRASLTQEPLISL